MTSPTHRPSPCLLAPATLALTLLGLAHQDVVFPSLCFLCIVGSYFHPWCASRPKQHPWLTSIVIGTALFFLCLLYDWAWLLNGEGLSDLRRFWDTPWLVSTGTMLQAAVLLWAWHLPRQSTGLIFACMGLIAISSGHILSSSYGVVNLYALFGGTCLLSLFVQSGAFHGGQDQPFREQCRQRIVILSCIAIISAGTWSISTSLQHAGHALDVLLADLMSGSPYRDPIGAGDSIRIAHQRHVRLSRRVVATLSGNQSPVYLRTQVLSQYQQHRWTPSPALRPQPLSLNKLAGRRRTPQDTTPREVRLHVNLQGAVPLPYGVARLHVPESLSCLQTAGAIVRCAPASQLTSYAFESAKSHPPIPFGIGFALPAPDTDSALSRIAPSLQHALSAPEAVLAPLRPLARRIAGTAGTRDLVAAQKIQQYFRQHFAYSRHVKLSPERDPIVDFIHYRRPAYCEYFASGMALMLRALGIPARVVGGFLVWEYNALLQQWIVRQRDAHAWVEVYDDMGQRWVGFDATPAFRQAQVARTGLTELLEQSRAWVDLQIRTMVNNLYPINTRLMQLRQLETGGVLIAVQSLILLVFIASAYCLCRRFHRAIYRWWRPLRWPARRRPSSTSDAVQAEAQHHFARLAALLQRRGLPILPTETLEEYLDRCQNGHEVPSTFIERLTDFSHAYHQLRFCPWPAELQTQQVCLQKKLLLIRHATDQLQQIQWDSTVGRQSNESLYRANHG